jgi:CRISPR-associated protein Cas5t
MTEKIQALRLKISLPSAHFRYPFTFQKRYTYPIPPYSTVLGFLTNLFNPEREKTLEEIRRELEGLEIAICGNFESKTINQYWFRNLSEKYHIQRFYSPYNRILDFQVEHPGGQSPIKVEVLKDVLVFVYLNGDREKLHKLENRINHALGEMIEMPHLGRAEDIISDIIVEFIELKKSKFVGKVNRYFWIPNEGDFKNKSLGLLQKIPFCKLNDSRDFRLFQFKEVYLNEGNFPPQASVISFVDKELNQPVFFTTITCGG